MSLKKKNPVFSDERGVFSKVFNREDAPMDIVQGNWVKNSQKGIFRGLHMQLSPYSESKKFNVLKGCIQLVWLDLRKEMDSYGDANSDTLVSGDSLLLPKGLATGYLVLEDDTEVLYFSDQSYHAEKEIGCRWNDPLLKKIAWEVPPTSVSEKDENWPNFQL